MVRNIESLCDACHTNPYPKKLRTCGNCKTTAYCNADCQRAHWKEHKSECKRIRARLQKEAEAQTQAKARAEADKISSGEAKKENVKIIVNNEKVILSRVKDDDGYVYANFMPGREYGSFIQATKPECWCGDVGLKQSLLVAFPFHVESIKNRGGYVKSQYLNTPFGVNFQLHISEIMGNLSVDLSEELKPNVPLTSTSGVQCRATYWFLKGGDATSIVLPPPSHGKFKRAGETVCNSHLNTWCGVGLKTPLGLHESKNLPRVTGKSLRSTTNFQGDTAELPDEAVVLLLMVEDCGPCESTEQFEMQSIETQLHIYHADAVKEAEIPDFCKNACRIGLHELNMKQPVPLVGELPPDKPSKNFVAPKGMNDLSPAALTMIQGIMAEMNTGNVPMGQIEEALGDSEAGPVLQNILASPQMAPLIAQAMAKMDAGKK